MGIIALLDGGDKAFWRELSTGWSVLACLPFAALLLSIAVLPLAVPHWWEHNRNKGIVAAFCGVPVGLFFLNRDSFQILQTGAEYAAFIVLLGSLFVISGGIYVRGSLAGTPLVNTGFLAVGSVLASFMGTTGASMLLIRPLLRANQKRKRKSHVVIFFIFIVANTGGCLTPLGDPPLFLGFLKGVPFAWTLRFLPQWALLNAALLILFHFLDQYQFDKGDVETKGSLVEDVQSKERIGIEGWHNIGLLGGVVLAIYASGTWIFPWAEHRFGHLKADFLSKGVQILLMATLAGLSLRLTSRKIRSKNQFTWSPIVEVAVLFAGIFMAMIPALLILDAKGDQFGLKHPWQYFWLTGGLSSFLDNAPTYLTYLSVAQGAGMIPQDLRTVGDNLYLVAISLGAVFMGANTYIGNGPNFMVKAIAEEAKIPMPSFFGYMKWSIAILIPFFIAVTFLFFRGAS